MSWCKYIADLFRSGTSSDVKDYRTRLEAEVEGHWKGHAIRLKELIWERWQEPPTDNHGAADMEANYLVFIDIEGDLDWISDDGKVPSESLTLIARIMDTEAVPCKHLGEEEWMAFKRMLGTAIVSALEGAHDDAVALMSQAQSYIERRIPERSRLWTLEYATIGMPLFIFLFVQLSSFSQDAAFAIPFIFGLSGAYVSIVRHASVRKVDSSAGKLLHVTEALVRLLIGAMLGKMGVLFCQSSLAPEFAKHICTTSADISIVAFASGLFDAFIPAMISMHIIKPMASDGEQNA